MKIKLLCRILWPAGTQRIAIEETKALTHLGHDAELIFIRATDSGETTYKELLNKVEYRILHYKNDSILTPLYDKVTGIFMDDRRGEGRVDYNFLRDFWKELKTDIPDLLICHDQWAGLAGYYAKKKLGIKYSVYIHERVSDYPWVRGLKRPLAKLASFYEHKVLTNAEKVFAVTDKVALTIREKHGVEAITNLPGTTLDPLAGNIPKENFLITISNWSTVKHPELYLEFVESVPSINLVMLGHWVSQKYRQDFLNEIMKRGLNDRLIVKGEVSETQKRETILRAKALIRFGVGEFGPGMAILEALECLTPVIVNNDLGMSGLIKQYKIGYIMEDNSYFNTKLFLERLDDPDFRYKISHNIRQFVLNNSWENHVKRLLYETLQKSKRITQ